MKAVSDLEARTLFSQNVNRLLVETGRNVHWLMVVTQENANRIYPACRGETNVSVGLMTRVAAALGVTLDDLVPVKSMTTEETAPKRPRKANSRILEKSA